jgi:hypothetical protein
MAVLALLQVFGCGGGNGGGGTSPAAATGTLKLAITDKQSDEYAKVVISIREIRLAPTGKENAADDDPGLPVLATFSTPRVIDVMQLQYAQQALGEKVLPSGTYNQIRLVLETNPAGQGQDPVNYVVLKSAPDVKRPLKAPSSQQSGLKLLGTVTVTANTLNVVTIDFDPNTAIVARGNADFTLKPTGIRLVQTSADLTTFGAIAGTVSSSFKDWSSATVSVKRRGTVVDVDPLAVGKVFSSYSGGKWLGPFTSFVSPNAQGVSYKAFIAATRFRLYSSPGVSVTQGQTTNLGTITLVPQP